MNYLDHLRTEVPTVAEVATALEDGWCERCDHYGDALDCWTRDGN